MHFLYHSIRFFIPREKHFHCSQIRGCHFLKPHHQRWTCDCVVPRRHNIHMVSDQSYKGDVEDVQIIDVHCLHCCNHWLGTCIVITQQDCFLWDSSSFIVNCRFQFVNTYKLVALVTENAPEYDSFMSQKEVSMIFLMKGFFFNGQDGNLYYTLVSCLLWWNYAL